MTARLLLAVTLALLCATATARASLDETLDVAPYASRTSIAPASGPIDAFGGGMRLGVTLHDVRFGAGVGAYAPPTRSPLLSAEAYVGYAPGGFWELRPFVELRAHAECFDLRDPQRARSRDATTFVGVGPRFGVLAPLSEYFFVEAGLGMDFAGPERLRGSVAFGLPIPLSHL